MTENRKGTILVASLWILAILSILAMGIGFRISVEARLAKYNIDRVRALYIADAGLYKTMQLLTKKSIGSGPDTIRQCGIVLRDNINSELTPEKIFVNIRIGDGHFTVAHGDRPGPSDEERRININTAPDNVILNLLNATVSAALDPSKVASNQEIARSIVAWTRTADDQDDSYYQQSGYERKKGKYSAVEELLLVKGVTPEIFNSIKDYVTIYGDKVNINTASDKILLALGLDAATVAQIINYRNGPDGVGGTKDDLVITDADIAHIDNVLMRPATPNESAIISKLKTQSSFFRIESVGVVDKTKVVKNITAIVQKEQGKIPLRSYREY